MTTLDIPLDAETAQRVRLLIVEDEYILAANLQESLEALGYIVLDIIDSAEVAIEKAAELRPNLILMDIRLRGEMDGIQAAEQIWNELQIPVIYITGHSDKSTVERATLTFPFGYILKPIREKELYVAIQTALHRHKREQFLSAVLRQMGDGVVVADPELHIKYLNEVAEGMTGWQLDEAKEQQLDEIIHFINERTHRPVPHPMVVALEEGTTAYLEPSSLLVTKQGTTLPVADSATPLKGNEGEITGAVMVFRDDTQRRLLEERNLANERAQQLNLQVTELQRLNRLKDDFLATTSHELRTPLSNISLAIYMLESLLTQQGILEPDTPSAPNLIDRYLTILREQCDQELKLVNDLLDMRSLDADAYPLDLVEIQLQTWLPHVAESFQERAIVQQQMFQIDIPPEFPPLVSDAPGLTRVFSELLHNACKYTPLNEQILVVVQLIHPDPSPDQDSPSEMVLHASKSWVQFTISNSGVEIPANHLSRIFDPFYRIPGNDPWKYGGTGLGLALVKKLVEYLQGTIDVSSSANWTNFIVQLPLRITNQAD